MFLFTLNIGSGYLAMLVSHSCHLLINDCHCLGGHDLLCGALLLHGGGAGGGACNLQHRSGFLLLDSFHDILHSEAEVGESVDPCCASQAITHANDAKHQKAENT